MKESKTPWCTWTISIDKETFCSSNTQWGKLILCWWYYCYNWCFNWEQLRKIIRVWDENNMATQVFHENWGDVVKSRHFYLLKEIYVLSLEEMVKLGWKLLSDPIVKNHSISLEEKVAKLTNVGIKY